MSVVARRESQYDHIVRRLKRFNSKQLDAVQAVMDTIDGQEDFTNILPFQAQTEEQLLLRIDHSLAQIEAGLYEDADAVIEEMLAEIGI